MNDPQTIHLIKYPDNTYHTIPYSDQSEKLTIIYGGLVAYVKRAEAQDKAKEIGGQVEPMGLDEAVVYCLKEHLVLVIRDDTEMKFHPETLPGI